MSIKQEPKTPPNYYVILPSEIRYNKKLNPGARILYGEILALSSHNGYCTASNQYWASLFDVDDKTISEWVKQLDTLGYVRSSVLKNYQRKIYPQITHLKEKKLTGVSVKDDREVSEKPDNNNTSINTINNTIQDKPVEVFNSEEYFRKLLNAKDATLNIIAYYTLKKGNESLISNEKQASAVIARNYKVAKRLSVFEKSKISKAIDECQNTIIKGQPMNYTLETVERFLLK